MSVTLHLFDVIWTNVYLEWFCIIAKSIDVYPNHPISNLHSQEWVMDTNGAPRQKDGVMWKGDRVKLTRVVLKPRQWRQWDYCIYILSVWFNASSLTLRLRPLGHHVLQKLILSHISVFRCCKKWHCYIWYSYHKHFKGKYNHLHHHHLNGHTNCLEYVQESQLCLNYFANLVWSTFAFAL